MEENLSVVKRAGRATQRVLILAAKGSRQHILLVELKIYATCVSVESHGGGTSEVRRRQRYAKVAPGWHRSRRTRKHCHLDQLEGLGKLVSRCEGRHNRDESG